MPTPDFAVNGPFGLEGVVKTPLPGPVNQWIECVIGKATGLSTMDRIYRNLPAATSSMEFLDIVLDLFGITYAANPGGLLNIPKEGPAVIVANHPFGGLEGVILAHCLLQHRSDVKFMANYMLRRVPEIRDLFIGVDPFGGETSVAANMRPMRESLRWLKSGGLLVVFPAGEVSHLHLSRGQVTDPAWRPVIAGLIRATGSSVIPLHFQGTNSLAFRLLGLVHPRVRTAMLAREFMNKENRRVEFTIGKTISPKRLQVFEDNAELIRYLRLQTYSLAAPHQTPASPAAPPQAAHSPIAAAIAPALLAREINALPRDQNLGESGNLAVYCARSEQIPHTLQEIGRLREITFRATGEGTGKSSDIDLYDSYYLHLILWDREQNRIAGGYRLGLSDEIMNKYGKRGFYTHSLFRYRSRLLKSISPSIELGRSFVCEPYQRSYAPLMLLWKGIGAFVSRHPRYRVLFGPVSISADYQTSSQQLLVDFLRANRFEPQLSRFVRPKKPFRRSRSIRWSVNDMSSIRDIDRLSDMISRIEAGDKGIPILLKQYLKLGGKLLGFNVDPAFNNALDGLIMVDLCQTDMKTLQKYMGKDNAGQFLDFHRAAKPDWKRAS